MSRITRYSGFSWNTGPDGKTTVHFREADDTPNSKTFESREEALAWVRDAAPKRLEQLARLSRPGVLLDKQLEEYDPRLARNSTKLSANKRHRKKVLSELKKMFDGCGWLYLSDLSVASLDKYFLEASPSAASRHRITGYLRTFLQWQSVERKHEVPSEMGFYKVKKPKTVRKRRPWKSADFLQYEAYLLKDIEVLAACDPRMPWNERIRECCLDSKFAQRMRLVPFYFLASRYLLRMSEACEVQTGDWNSRDRVLLPLSFKTDNPRTILPDRETSWILDCLTVGRESKSPLIPSSKNRACSSHYLHAVASKHIKRSGLVGATPYGVKYGAMSEMFRNPEAFTNLDIAKKLAMVRAISGHTEYSDCAELYIEAFWGSEHHVGVRDYYDANPVLPFNVEDFPTVISPGFHRKSG